MMLIINNKKQILSLMRLFIPLVWTGWAHNNDHKFNSKQIGDLQTTNKPSQELKLQPGYIFQYSFSSLGYKLLIIKVIPYV